ncbi:MAG: EAL domain-containing protein [Magnetococcus sp. WYHC-3]
MSQSADNPAPDSPLPDPAALFEVLYATSIEGVVLLDGAARILRINPAFQKLTGHAPEDLVGQSALPLMRGVMESWQLREIRKSLARNERWQGVLRLRMADGSSQLMQGSLQRVVPAARSGVETVLLAQFHALSESGETPADHNRDPLTRLPSRSLFKDRLEQAIITARRADKCVGVIFLDLDRFKVINESFSHAGGDQLLRVVGERLGRCLRTSDSVARIGPDEFALLLSDINDSASAVRNAGVVAQKVIESISQPVQLGDQEIQPSAALGITLFPQDGRNAQDLLEKAATALSHAREQERNSFQFFSAEMTESARRRFELEGQLRRAIERGELVIYYQPQVELGSGRVIGAEALVRWQHPERGMISPAHFIPVAEETGLIVPIGEWVLRSACHQIAMWQRLELPPIRVGVNLSAVQFKRQDLARLVRELLDETGIEAHHLDLEITESAIMEDVDRAVKMLNEINSMGVHLSIDDFGTGYSSLSQLRQFPFQTLKIDRSFIKDIENNQGDAAIVSAIIAMAHSLNQTVIVEGLERREQLSIMRSLDANEMQGFLFSAAIPADKFTDMLIQGAHLDIHGEADLRSVAVSLR